MEKNLLEDVAEALRKRGFAAECFATGADAAARVMELAADAKSVGFGGSVTVVMDRRPSRTDVHVLLVDEDLGY